LKANWNFSVISHTLSLDLGVVQVFAFVAAENSMFDCQFFVITRTRLHQITSEKLTAIHPMAIYRVKFFSTEICCLTPTFKVQGEHPTPSDPTLNLEH
jgi:hypothetical protein